MTVDVTEVILLVIGLLVGVVVGAVALGRWRLDGTWLLLGTGVLAFWVADSLYLVTNANGTYDSGSWFDAGWNLAFLLWAAAAWAPQRRARARRRVEQPRRHPAA